MKRTVFHGIGRPTRISFAHILKHDNPRPVAPEDLEAMLDVLPYPEVASLVVARPLTHDASGNSEFKKGMRV